MYYKGQEPTPLFEDPYSRLVIVAVFSLCSDDDRPFIVLTETKFSLRCIPVWIGTLLTGLGSKKNTCDNVLTMTSKVPW